MADALRLGIAGLGTVGVGVIKMLHDNRDMITARAGKPIEVVAVSARSQKDRGVDLSSCAWEEDAVALASRDDVDVVVELIGGEEGIAKTLCESALAHNKSVVTANKALIAYHGKALAEAAQSNGLALMFEASVAGGTPILKTIREGLVSNAFTSVRGILNGTSNYILTTMEKEKREFDDVLKEAQDIGYAEADPSLDVDGGDAGHKLVILAALAFGNAPNMAALELEGMRSITSLDIDFAKELGYRIKVLGIATNKDGKVSQHVYPCLVPLDHPMAAVDDSFNAVEVMGNEVGRIFIEGRGAGEGPTATAVVSDIIDIARGHVSNPFSIPTEALGEAEFSSMQSLETCYYLRLPVKDTPGVLAEITEVLKQYGISVNSIIQHAPPSEEAQIVIATHETQDAKMQEACEKIAALPIVIDKPQLIRMEAS